MNLISVMTRGLWGVEAGLRAPTGSPVTTQTAILEALAEALEDLVPTTHSETRFERKRSATADDFRDLAVAGVGNCFRWFELSAAGWDPMEYSNMDVERRQMVIELAVAYPQAFGKYAAKANQTTEYDDALYAVMEDDLSQAMKAIGINGKANYPNGSFPVAPESVQPPDIGEGVTFGVVEFDVEYFYDTNA